MPAIHNMSHSRLYHIWNGMKQRCANPRAISYKYYGAKGVSVCDEWQSFLGFCSWALENGYADGLTLDRINSRGNYEPQNCRWATPKQQQNNISYNRLLTFDGKTLNITQWSELTGISRHALYHRVHRGWDTERILTKR